MKFIKFVVCEVYKIKPKLKMIIRRLFNSSSVFRKTVNSSCLPNPLYSFSQNTPAQIDNKKQLLNQVLKQVNMLKQSSIFMQQTEQIQARNKKSLTKQDKLKLGLYIPKMPINHRMNIDSQLSYRQKICENLYEMQKAHLSTRVRILQKLTQSEHFTMDKYINTVYKDIYARYLINKGIGLQWKGRYSSYGMLNSTTLSSSPTSLITDFIRANLDYIQKIESIAPYSYLTQSFVPTDLIEVENIRKIGHYIKLPLTEFGKHQKNFQKLRERGGKVQLLVFCQFLQKLINPHCLCLIPGQKMIILKRHYVQKSIDPTSQQSSSPDDNNQSGLRFQYLITSLQIFNKHKQFFTNKQYEKHLLFESDHLVGMKAQYGLNLNDTKCKIKLPIMSQIEGYERNPGLYIVNASTSIPDYERVQQFRENKGQVHKLQNVLDTYGKLNLTQSILTKSILTKNKESTQTKDQGPLSIIDIEFEQKLLQVLKTKLDFQELYDVFEDQVYSNKQTSQVLRFRLFDKFQIPIRAQSYNTLSDYFSSKTNELVLHQSKVKLPQFKKFNKPRQRRNYKKQVRQSLKQRTDYLTLVESIKSISNVPVSGSVKGDLKLWFQKDQQNNIINVYDNSNDIEDKTNLEEVTISSDLVSAISYLYNTQHSHDLNSIIIEPQTFTEQILPLCLHLTLFKMKEEPSKRGRRTTKPQSSSSKKLLESLKMIYLHPTMKPTQREIQVHSFITGSMKISNKQDYGFGFEAIRLWVCKHSDYLGDRQLKQRQVNQELKNSSFIRKLYAQLIPLVPKSQLSQSLNKIGFDKLNFLDRFMHEQIDAYILNMEHFYSRLMLKEAYQYTMDFYRNIVEEIFVKTVRHHIITYPNEKDNLSHGVTIRKILQLLSVIAPLFPFSTFHISKTDIMKWPQVNQKQNFYRGLLEYNALIKIRTELRNKLLINKFSHCQIVFPISNTISYTQEDLKKFFGVDRISFTQPEVKQKRFNFQLRYNQTIGGRSKISVHESKDHCIRCDPDSKQKEHLCHTCTDYLQTNVGKQIEFYDKRHNSLLIQDLAQEKQLKEKIV